MELSKYHMKTIQLLDSDDNTFSGIAHYCDKDDYETDEDGLELLIGGAVTIFYASDIKSITLL